MTDFTKEAKKTLDEVLNELGQYTNRIEKIQDRIQELKQELKELDQDEDFDDYHKKNQEISYYEKQLILAVDEYEAVRSTNRMAIESKLYTPILKGMNATKKSVDYDRKKDEIVDDFTKKMNELSKEHNEAITEYVGALLPELEKVKDHFGDVNFKNMNLEYITGAYLHFKKPLEEYLKENRKE